ncbi:MAG: universal stress protein [Zoogloea sp.]|uniref:universal stress protein n=1 Tax=Zoogloea sp. TaxID=49181 RepID=UPI0026321C66|nr:universal stress protein [Zoogloea sp.]MDD2989283.1 universal stress protein [Zoogloea sp.]
MNTIRQILAATDLSAPARHAMDRGFQLAATSGARYTVLHALHLGPLDTLRGLLGDGSAQIGQRLEEAARDNLGALLADPTHHRGVAASLHIHTGTPVDVITTRADAEDADLLVVGARGEAFLRHGLLGSTASRLLRRTAARPVLVVKQPPHEPYRRILAPVDFSPGSVQSLRLAHRLVPTAHIVLIHVFNVPFEGKLALAGVDEVAIHAYRRKQREESLQRLHVLASTAGLEAGHYSVLVPHGDPAQQVIAQEQEQDADLILVGKHGTELTEELLLGSVTKRILNESQCDVLVVPDPRRVEHLHG